MADAYGTLTFTKSQDCSYDPKALQSALNSLRWDNEGGFWEISPSSAGLVFCQQRVQYPTVHPETDDAYIFVSDEDGSYYEKMHTEMDENDWDDYYDIRTRELSLEELAAIFLPLIEQGWIEIAYASSEKCRYVEFGLLRLNRNGKSQRHLHRSGPQGQPVDTWEEFQPDQKSVTQ